MNTLKKTLALVSTLAMAATVFAGCGKDEDKDSSSSNNTAATTAANNEEGGNAEETTAAEEGGNDTDTTSNATKSEEVGAIDASVATGGDTFTVAAWNADDVPALIAQWKGTDYEQMKTDLADNKVDGIELINFQVGGGDASAKYDELFNSGKDLDVYFCEADWALKYINDDSKTLALDKLGFTDANFADIYSYTDEIGKDSNGVRKGVSWQAAAGGFAYRADLAEEYLGVTSPEEMQAQIGDWDKFVAAAQTIADKSGGKTALADTLGGMWQAFACGRTQAWVDENDVLQIDDSCKKFADTAKTLWDMGGVTKNEQWASDGSWQAAGVDGSCMGYFVSTWGFGGFFLDANGGVGGETYGKWAVCQGPTPYYWGGTWIVVNPATDNGQEAQDFIKSATVSNDQMKTYSTTKPEFVNNKTVMDELIGSGTVFNKDITGEFKDGQNFYAELAKNVESINFNGLITPYDAAIKSQFINAVKENYLTGASWEDTVSAFEDNVVANVPGVSIG